MASSRGKLGSSPGLCPVDDIANADLLGHAHGAGIARKRKRLRKPQLALVIVFVIGRFPDFVGVRIYINKRGASRTVDDGVKPKSRGCGIDNGLEVEPAGAWPA